MLTAGSCFRINYAQPYTESLTKYTASVAAAADPSTWDPFYVPFPASNTPAITGSTPSGATQIERKDDYTVWAYIPSDGAKFSFDITGFVNPFSQLKDSSA